MTNTAIYADNIWKKFKKGEKFDSLRELIPSIAKEVFSLGKQNKLDEQEFWALKDISFELKRGEALGIIGPNGAGKSTLLKILTGIMNPTQGSLDVNGRLSALIEVGAGFHPDLTGRENIFLNATILGMKMDEIRSKFDQIVEFSELSDFIDTPVKRYSSGMFARLGFSVAAHVDPDILLIDEVLSVGDFMFQHKCIEKMKEIVGGGTTVIFVSHNIPSVIKLCPSTILLNKGEIQKYGDSGEVCRHYYRAHAENRKVIENGEMALSDFSLINVDGSPSNAYNAGEVSIGKAVIESQIEAKDVIMGFFIKNSDGEVVFDSNSDKLSNRFFQFEKGERKEIDFEFRVNLPEGTYYIGIHLMHIDTRFYLYCDEISELYVNAPKTMGSAFCDIRWQ